jgi:predicted HAD superfamily hydrolase
MFTYEFPLQDNYNVLHIASMYSREDVVKLILNKKGSDAYSTGGVSRTSD